MDDDYYEEPEEIYEESPCRTCKAKGEGCQGCIWGEEPRQEGETMNIWEEYVTLTPSEWYEWFIMANRDVSVTFGNNMKARAYVVGRHDSLAKGHYDGEYLNIELWSEDNNGPDPDYEIAIDLWSSCLEIEFWINHDQYIIHIGVDEIPEGEI